MKRKRKCKLRSRKIEISEEYHRLLSMHEHGVFPGIEFTEPRDNYPPILQGENKE